MARLRVQVIILALCLAATLMAKRYIARFLPPQSPVRVSASRELPGSVTLDLRQR